MYCEGNLKSPYVALLDADIGIPSPYEYMKPLIRSLSKQNIRACVLERGGYGFSDTGPLPRDGNHTLNEIVSTIYESRMRTPFLYIAHSSASFTARALASEYPELLSGMILLHPSHEDQELILLKQVKNLTDNDIQLRKDTRDYIDDVIRYVNPIALPRLFKYFHFEFLLEYEDPYELYYMNGWKSYFDHILNLTNTSINRKVIFQNKYTGCVWSELKHFQSDTAESIKYLRFKSSINQNNNTTSSSSGNSGGNTAGNMIINNQSNSTLVNNDDDDDDDESYKKIPTIILTAKNLIDGNCESNHFTEGSNMCNNFNMWKEGRGQAIKKLHSDLASFYNAKWDLIESSYDLPIDVPDVIAKYAKNLFLKIIKN
ncbi:predicted protein [Naegleria gruberi]|uniref:Predicted protein n=1 Tax=Naegleria gruberi TaxID=5762 RepID=D2W2D6_NAEGR|nr:uncharacterized protein NAEGRDRAFT_75551 [Naegleria gruberi]EFC36842.1 predicted protein [Naegleria gruberi]|eukprot:XP_002669586.1 predicted protein [Naegleria gruberi strain NEG-M]